MYHKYLSIDSEKLIDYSEFREPAREQLFRDCLEMIRHEKGIASNRINYLEFVRYAHLQAEELLNYFYSVRFNKEISKIMEFVQINYQTPYTKAITPSNLNQLDYRSKLMAFANSTNMPSEMRTLLITYSRLRNEISHRNSLLDSIEDETMVECVKEGILKGSKLYINFKTASKEQIDLYNKALLIMNKRNADFAPAYQMLENLKRMVLTCLQEAPGRFSLFVWG